MKKLIILTPLVALTAVAFTSCTTVVEKPAPATTTTTTHTERSVRTPAATETTVTHRSGSGY